jgi:hypothetical protein
MSTSHTQDTLNALRAGKLAGIKRLDLSCGLTNFPEEIFELADSLEILNLSGNQLSSLPDELTKLKNLKIIFCSENQFTHLPEVLGEFEHLNMVGFKANQIRHCPESAISNKLRWLILTDNALTEIPKNIGDCKSMQKLMLAGNQLSAIPESLMACQNLELLRISANAFNALPEWLFTLPRLAWLAYAGNPLTLGDESQTLKHSPLPNVDWSTLSLGEKLGEGASGLIYQAKLTKRIHEHPTLDTVAVKVFKGAVTSDGLPESEMAAWISAGNHPNIAPVIANLVSHPQKMRGLVMPLIDSSFKILAGPPSLSSCTRDTYAPTQQFSLQQVLSIARGIAEATAHLHRQGVLHGDLYAHNILFDGVNKVLLSDFGGAARLPLDNQVLTEKLTKIETLAFAHLLEELVTRCQASPEEQASLQAMQRLAVECQRFNLNERPNMQEVAEILSNIA